MVQQSNNIEEILTWKSEQRPNYGMRAIKGEGNAYGMKTILFVEMVFSLKNVGDYFLITSVDFCGSCIIVYLNRRSSTDLWCNLLFLLLLIQQNLTLYLPMSWNSEELALLQTFKNLDIRVKWKNICQEFERKGFSKNQMECKQKWMQLYNQDPENSCWSVQELQYLFALYDKHNSQWSTIHKSIPAKNKIQIRNKFYGTIRNLIRFVLEYFKIGCGQTTTISNKIKPLTLQKLYNSQEEFEFSNGLIRRVIHEMGLRMDKQKLWIQVKENQQIYLKVIKSINKREKNIKDNLVCPNSKEVHYQNDRQGMQTEFLQLTQHKYQIQNQTHSFQFANQQVNYSLTPPHPSFQPACLLPTPVFYYPQSLTWFMTFPLQ